MEATRDPTPMEISQHCRRIQDGWSVETARTRGAWAYECEPVELRQVQVVELLELGENRH